MNYLESIIKTIDQEMVFLGNLGEGSFGKVFKVGLNGGEYALKVQTSPGIRPIGYEFGVQRALKGVQGIPEAIKLYGRAFLMQCIDGELMHEAYYKNGGLPASFFDRLGAIASGILSSGYSLPKDFGTPNILVDRSQNPWVIDFMFCNKMGPEDIKVGINLAGLKLRTLECFYGKKI